MKRKDDPTALARAGKAVLGQGSRRTRASVLLRSLRRDRAGMVGLALVSGWLGLALFGPSLVKVDPNSQDLQAALLPPFWQAGGVAAHLLGTDYLGRDLLARVIWGARTSIAVGSIAVAGAAGLGSLVGLAAAESGAFVEELLMRLADVQLSIPFILLAVSLLSLLGASLGNMTFVLILSGWVVFARVVRSELLHLREAEFVHAARALGASRIRIALRHLAPNVVGLIVVLGSLELANVIILEAALSFLGLGVRPPLVSWGAMLADGRDYLTVAWWLATLPGLAITAATLGANLLGDWIRDFLDPRRRTR